MVKIPGWVYVFIGFLVAIPSYIIDREKLFLFFLIGVIFIAIGFIKVVGKKPRPRPRQPKIVFCPYCGQAVYDVQLYCHRCRSKLK